MSGAVETAELIKWWDAMDKLIGMNGSSRRDAEGMQMARACQHEDSKWLCALFPDDKPVPSDKEMKQVFAAQNEDRRALFFAGTIAVRDWEMVRRSAELGYAPAQAWFATICQGRERFEWAAKAAAQGDRTGLFQLAWCWMCDFGCTLDKAKALQLYKLSAKLGHTIAQWWCGENGFDENSWERYYWWGQAAKNVVSARESLAEASLKRLKLLDKGKVSGRVLFEIGAACKGHLGDGTAFGNTMRLNWLNALKQAVALHDEWCIRALPEMKKLTVSGACLPSFLPFFQHKKTSFLYTTTTK